VTTTKDSLKFDQVSIAQSFDFAVASGEIPQISTYRVHGRNTDIGTTVEDVWTVGGLMSWSMTATSLNIWSNSLNDSNTTTSSGVRSVRVYGLLSGFTNTTEDIYLNGLNTVTSNNSFIRINRISALDVGTYSGTNDSLHGTITFNLNGTSTANLYVDDSIACAETQLGRYTVPDGYEAYIAKIDISVASGKSANIYLFKRENADDVTTPYSARKLIAVYDGLTGHNPITFEWTSFPAKTDIWFAAKAAGVNTSVSIEAYFTLKAVT